jgi:hypothetical protein
MGPSHLAGEEFWADVSITVINPWGEAYLLYCLEGYHREKEDRGGVKKE